ncbi:Uncharacterised protein [Mycobacterium tuberculosis]|nr:Uncharacterised protein [Mycobacterium tuberculosis]
MPHHDEAVPLRGRVGADAHVGLAFDLAVGNLGVGAVTAPPPPVPGADDVLAFHFAADAHVGAQVLAVGVHHVHLAGFGAEYHQFLAEVVGALHVTGGQVGGEGDDEPSRREPVLRQRDARSELLVRWIHARIRSRVRNRICHEALRFPRGRAQLGRPSTRRSSTARSIFTILSIERQRAADRPVSDVRAEWSCNDGSRGGSLRFFVVAQWFSRRAVRRVAAHQATFPP